MNGGCELERSHRELGSKMQAREWGTGWVLESDGPGFVSCLCSVTGRRAGLRQMSAAPSAAERSSRFLQPLARPLGVCI